MAKVATAADFRDALQARDRAGVNRLAALLLDQRTGLGGEWFSIAHVLAHNGEVTLALAAAERGVAECNGVPGARFELAHILSNIGRQEEALAIVSAIMPGEMNAVQRDHFLGACALEAGDFEQARSAFDRVVTIWPGAGPSWLSLAALPAQDDPGLIARLETASAAIREGQAEYQAQWHYAKGTVLDRLGMIEQAFSDFAAGAALMRPSRAFDPETDRREVEMLITEFTAPAMLEISQQIRTNTSRPIIVTGLPRSGTTLVEQFLASHSLVSGGDETPFAEILTREIGGNSLSRLQAFVGSHGADQLATLYLHLGDEYFGKGQRFVDKCLGNSRDLGVLASVLPEARIVWLRRDPLDCAWSCFRTFFSEGIEWSYALTDIAAHFEADDRLYAHWRDVLAERMLTVSYEELVADPKLQLGRILDHVGLDYELTLDTAHRSRRAVTTASVAQVRQPVYQSSVGAAGPYREQLRPFILAYGASVTPAA